jgi:hypothetical protein
MPRGVDLFTETRKAPESLRGLRAFVPGEFKYLFLYNIILFKYCTEMKIALSDGHLGISSVAYPQSYPQILWVSHFPFCGNSLWDCMEALSSIVCQASEPA